MDEEQGVNLSGDGMCGARFLDLPPVTRKPFWQLCLGALFVGLFFGFFIIVGWSVFGSLMGFRIDYLPVISAGLVIGAATRSLQPHPDRRLGVLAAAMSVAIAIGIDLLDVWGTVVFQTGTLPNRVFYPSTVWTLFIYHWTSWSTVALALTCWEGYHWATRTEHRRNALPRIPRYRLRQLVFLGGFAVIVSVMFLNLHRRRILQVTANPDGTIVVSTEAGADTTFEKRINWWTWPQRERNYDELPAIGRCVWAPDSQRIAVIANANSNNSIDPGRVLVWDLPKGRMVASVTGHHDFVTCLMFSKNGDLLATGGQDGEVIFWSTKNYQRLGGAMFSSAVSALAFSLDSRLIAVGFRDGKIAIIDVATMKILSEQQVFHSAVVSLAYSDDNNSLYSVGCVDRCFKRLVSIPLSEQESFPADFDWVTEITISPDYGLIAVSGGYFHGTGAVRLFNSMNGREIRRFDVPANTVRTCSFSGDGQTLFAGTSEPIGPFTWPRHGQLYLWNVQNGRELPELP